MAKKKKKKIVPNSIGTQGQNKPPKIRSYGTPEKGTRTSGKVTGTSGKNNFVNYRDAMIDDLANYGLQFAQVHFDVGTLENYLNDLERIAAAMQSLTFDELNDIYARFGRELKDRIFEFTYHYGTNQAEDALTVFSQILGISLPKISNDGINIIGTVDDYFEDGDIYDEE